MALRGFLPKIVQFYVNKYNPTYFECMHQADKIMVKKFNAIHDGERLPHGGRNTAGNHRHHHCTVVMVTMVASSA